MNAPVYNVLFLCTGNSARSILAEALLNVLGKGRFRAYSAGSHPVGRVQPLAIELARELGYDIAQLRSKSWDAFAATDAPRMDFILTVCDSAAGEACPLWPGHPATAHWGVPDPAAVEGSEAEIAAAFAETARLLGNRIRVFLNLPFEKLDRMSLQAELRHIGAPQTSPAQ